MRGLKKHKEAIEAWQTALKYGMSKKIVLTRIGDAYMNLQDYDHAELHYNEALDIGYDKYAYLGLARIHMIRNQIDEIYLIFKKLREQEPGDQRIEVEFKTFIEKYPELEKRTD